jgi:type III secretion protein L
MEHQPKILKKERIEDEVSLASRLEMQEAAISAAGLGVGKVLSAEDLRLNAERRAFIDAAKRDAEDIRDRAKALYLEVENRIKAAEEKGFHEGREKGLASVTETLVKIRDDNAKLMEGLEKQSVGLVFEIARKIIGDAFRTSEEALVGMIRQALAASLGNSLTVFVNPADYERIKASQPKIISALHGSQALNLRPAEAVKLNCCLVESELGTIEADLEMQLEAIAKALGLKEGA